MINNRRRLGSHEICLRSLWLTASPNTFINIKRNNRRGISEKYGNLIWLENVRTKNNLFHTCFDWKGL